MKLVTPGKDRPSVRRIVAPLALLLLLASPARAFHDGGVASCSGCHVMHESEDGQFVVAGDQLLDATSPTEVCLGCHATASGAVLAADPLAPGPEYGGGDFAFLFASNLNDGADGALVPIPGHAAGHDIVAPGSGLQPDPRWTTAPGGTFPSASLGCTSCHDPHGNASFRMLNGVGPVQGGQFHFGAPAPTAEGVMIGGAAESASNHTAYQDGWTRWCGNCHDPRYHQLGQSEFGHPVDRGLGATIAARYNEYQGDLNPTGGTQATAYLPAVPFEDPSQGATSTSGPFGGSRVSCITCHRAHASSAPEAGRWDFNVTALDQDGVISGSLPIPNPYPGLQQRSLCVKCHDVSHDDGTACLGCHLGSAPAEPDGPLVPIGN